MSLVFLKKKKNTSHIRSCHFSLKMFNHSNLKMSRLIIKIESQFTTQQNTQMHTLYSLDDRNKLPKQLFRLLGNDQQTLEYSRCVKTKPRKKNEKEKRQKFLVRAAIDINPKIRTGFGNVFIPWAMSGQPRLQWATTIPADQKQRYPPENLAFCSRLNGDDKKKR